MIKKILIMSFFCLSASFSFTQETGLVGTQTASTTVRQLNMNEAVNLAIQNNLNLDMQRIATGTKKRAKDLFWNNFIPTVSVSGSLLHDNVAASNPMSAIMGLPAQSGDPSQWHIQGQMQVTLGINAALFAGIATVKNDYSGGILALDKAKLQVEQGVRKLYCSILLLEEVYNRQKETLENLKEQEASTLAMYRAGRVPEIQWMQTRVQTQNQQPAVDQAEYNLRYTKSQFAAQIGLAVNEDFNLSPISNSNFFQPLDVKELTSKSIQNKPDILEVKQQINLLKSQRTASAVQSMTPWINLGWTGSTTLTNAFKDDFGNKDSWTDGGQFSITLQWTATNLIPFLKTDQGLRDMDDNIKTLNIRLAQTIQQTELDIINKVYEMERTRATFDVSQTSVAVAEKSYRDTLTSYNAGTSDFLSVNNALSQWRNAQLNVSQQYYTYLQGLVDLEYSIGVPFGTLY